VAGKNSLENAVKSAMVANMVLGTKIPIYKGTKVTMQVKVKV
jgi:hypothetical protein